MQKFDFFKFGYTLALLDKECASNKINVISRLFYSSSSAVVMWEIYFPYFHGGKLSSESEEEHKLARSNGVILWDRTMVKKLINGHL